MAISARELTLILRVQSAGAQNIRRLQADLNGLERGAGSMGQRFAMASQAIGAVGRQMQLAGGIGTFALGLAANQAAQLQSKVTLAATQVTHGIAQTRKQADKDFQGILSQMTKFPTSADDMAAALYDVYSTLNVTGKQGIPILQQINKAAVAGGLSAQEAGQGLLSIVSNFDKGRATAREAAKDFNVMFAAVRYGRATMEDLSTALATTAPAAKIAGQSLGNMAGTFAFLSRSLGPQKAAVSYARLVEVLSGTQMQDGLKKVGVNIDNANGKMKSMDQVIGILLKRFPYLAQGGVKALNFFKDIGNIQSTIQARRAFATLTSNFAGYRDILHKTIGDNNEFRKSYAAMAQSPGVQWNVLINNLKAVGLQIGMAVLPAFVSMSKYIKMAVDWFNKLSPSTKDLIGKFAAFGAVGALIGGTLLTIAAAAGGAVVAVAGLGDALAVFGAGIFAYTGLAALAKHIYDNWDELGGLMKAVGRDIKRIFEDLAIAAKAFYQGDWSTMWSHLGDAIKAAIPAVKDALNLMMQAVVTWGKEFVTTIQGVMTAALGGMFLARRMRGGGGGIGGAAGTALSTADLLSIAIGAPVGPMAMMTKAAAKSDDAEMMAKRLKVLQSGGIEGAKSMLATNAFTGALTSRQARALEAYVGQAEAHNRKLSVRLARSVEGIVNPFKYYREQVGTREGAMFQARQDAMLGRGAIITQGYTAAQNAALMRQAGLPETSHGARLGAIAQDLGRANAEVSKMPETLSRSQKAFIGLQAAGATAGSAIEKVAVSGAAKFKTFGMELLNFAGFGFGPWVGGIVAGGAAIYGLKLAMDHFFPSLQQVIDGEHKSAVAWKNTTGASKQASESFTLAKNNLDAVRIAMETTRRRLGNMKGGTDAYRQQLKLLGQEQDALKQRTLDLNDAQSKLAKTMQANLAAMKDVNLSQSLQTLQDLQSGRATTAASQRPQQAFSAGAVGMGNLTGVQQMTGQTYIDPATAKSAKSTIDSVSAAFKNNIAILVEAEASGRKFTATERAMRDAMGQMAEQHRGDIPQLAQMFNELNGNAMQLLRTLGRVPQNMSGFAQYAQSIPKNLLPAVKDFMRVTGQAPNVGFLTMLQNIESKGKGASRVMAAFVANMGHLPATKKMNFLFNRPPWLERWIANFIDKFHKMPTSKQVNIRIKAHDEATAKLRHAQRELDKLQQKAADFSQAHGVPAGGATPFDAAIQAAQQKMNKMKGPHVKGILRFTVQGNAFGKMPQQAATAKTNAVKAFNGMPKEIAAFGTSAGTGFATNFSQTAHATAHATISIMVNAYRKTIRASSPSKLFKEKVGDPILQGILEPLKKQSDIKDAANTAMSNMVDAFNSARDTYKGQLGDLFAGPTFMAPFQNQTELQQKLGFGEKVNIKDLRGDLQAQVHEFSRFQGSLRRLDRRKGTSFAFIDEIRQLGPAAQSEVNALLHATPRQLRQYERLWQRSQRAVNNTARRTVQSQVAAWRKQGAAVALGFMSGMQEHSAGMARFFRNLFLHLFHQVKHTHKSHSPSRLYMEEGMNVMQGFKLGVIKGSRPIDMPKLHPPVGRLHHARPLVQNITNNYYNRTYNIYPSREENLLSALRKHDHITRVHP